MNFPLSLLDIGLWLAATAMILLITSELLFTMPHYAAHVRVEKKRLRLVALGCGLGFMVTVVMRILTPF